MLKNFIKDPCVITFGIFAGGVAVAACKRRKEQQEREDYRNYCTKYYGDPDGGLKNRHQDRDYQEDKRYRSWGLSGKKW